jgi:hypothetical protein
MKKFLAHLLIVPSFVISSFAFVILNPNMANALEPCFSSVPDTNWRSIYPDLYNAGNERIFSRNLILEPKEVSESVRTTPKDFVVVEGVEFKVLNGDWQALPGKGNASLSLLPGDSYRAYKSYEGKGCSKRTVYLPTIVVIEIPTISMNQFIEQASANYQEAEKYKNILGDSLPFALNAEVQLGENEFERAWTSNEALRFLIQRRVGKGGSAIKMLFDTSCARTILKSDYYGKFMREGTYPVPASNPKFLKVGNCSAKVYDAGIVNSNNLMYLGTINFNVTDPLNTLKQIKPKNTISCIKAKITKKITGSKCPAGYKKA